jgi:hypothetical protein
MTTPTALEDPRVTLLALLSAGWTPANTPTVGTPEFSTSWGGENDNLRPVVTVTDRNDTPTASRGYSSIRGDGSGVNARKRGFVMVNCWSETVEKGTVASSSNPKQEAKEMWAEVERIVLANFSGTGALEMLRTEGPSSAEETTATGKIVRLFGRIEYEYELTPA